MLRFATRARPALIKSALYAASCLTAASFATLAHANNGDPQYLYYDGGAQLVGPNDMPYVGSPSTAPIGYGASGPALTAPGSVTPLSFEGISQYQTRVLGGGYSSIPPDTMGAVGTTQFMETSNGAYAIYDKTTGATQLLEADGAFWNAAGIAQPTNPAGSPSSNGDSRVLFDSTSQKWIVESFAPSLSNIQIAVSNDANALDGFKAVQFTAYNPASGKGIADYPTLAIDGAAIYIGTNDFDTAQPAATQFQGTTLNVISRSDIFGAGGPSVASLKQFFTPSSADRGYAIQGVNQVGGTDTGKIAAISAATYGTIRYDVNNPGTAGATETATTLVDTTPYDPNNPARQPSALNPQVVDTLDDRLSSAVWEQAGKIYTIHTITPTGGDHTVLQFQVLNAKTNAVLQTGYIDGGVNYDYYQGTITVNDKGEVVIGYNRSGSDPATGNISVFAQGFAPDSSGLLKPITGAILLQVSPTNDYHNGSVDGQAAVGRQRWGDYAQVTVDPTNDNQFWTIGEFAREPNDGVAHPGGTGGTRWSTFIAEIDLSAVPEPSTWAMMLTGFGLVGASMRRRAKIATV